MKKALQTPSKSVPMSNIQHQSRLSAVSSQQSAVSSQQSKLTKVFYFLVIMWVGIQTSYGQITISSNTTWDNSNPPTTGYEDGIDINNGITLTIDGITLSFNQLGYVLVSTGSKLIIQNNANLTAGAGGIWDGIYSIGNTLINNYIVQPSIVPPNIVQFWSGVKNPNQTYIIIKNNSTIQNCIIALRVGTGAIVEANNSSFKNCKSVYQNENQTTNPSYYPKSHASHFMDCQFIWDNTMAVILGEPFYGIKVVSVFGLNIGGCKFENTRSAVSCVDNRAIGIYADNSGIFVGESGNSDCTDNIGCPANCYNGTLGSGCQFINLSCGIEYKNGYNQNYSFLCRRSSFSNNYVAIKTKSSRNTKIYKNTFNGNRTVFNSLYNNNGPCGDGLIYSSVKIIKFIEFENGETFEAYDNEFDFTGQNVYYIHSLGNSTSNLSYRQKIQKNTFKNSNPQTINTNNVIGIYAQGLTPNMGIFCNEFNSMGVDIEVAANGSVKSSMSNNTGKAGNVFSTFLNNRFRVRNYGPATINYFHAGANSNTNREAPLNNPFSLNCTPNTTNIESPCNLICTDFESGIKYVEYQKLFNLYPNPSSSSLNINGNNLIESISIVNQLGQIVYRNSNINDLIFNLNVSEFAKGVYYIIVNNTEKHIFIKN